ncbi:site-specific integrase [Vibrio anguillarum]|nr:hypothetical protein [Vibrio anguillarum]MBF4289917.1 hypothetical protein [Vibrio anguillarum]MBF4340670.1 hypothetical protein [Vibrio anguillarum]MBF4356910.1 hypothetical protein [Vibrio anguillarum]MBF4377602.1 hypothetical protein [Vibrio anguillarum]
MIDTELKLLGVLLDVEIYKKRLLNWWHSLTDEQKLAVPTNKNTIDLRDRLSDAPVTYVQIRQYLKDDINKIEAELKSLGILFDHEAYRARLLNWWQSLTNNQKKTLPVVNNTIDLRDLFADSPIKYHVVRQIFHKEIDNIDKELKSLNVLFDREAYRSRLVDWWASLTNEQKQNVSISQNSIDLRFLFSKAPIGYNPIRLYLKEDIKKINTELKSLGVLKNVDDETIVTLMSDFISECKVNPDLLWDVELSIVGMFNSKLVAKNPDSYFEQYGLISTKYLSNKLSCKVKQLEEPELLDLRKQLNKLLLEYKVSLPYSEIKNSSHAIGYDLNNRRIFLKWKNGLTYEEKLALPMFRNVITQKTFHHLIPTHSKAIARPLLRAEYLRFSREVIEIKGIDYKTMKERDEARRERRLNQEESKYSVFSKLRDKKLTSIDDFSSKRGRYEDVQHAFAIGSLNVSSKSGITTYYIGYKHYCDFLESKEISPDSSFKKCFSSWSLRDFKEYLGEKIGEGVLATSTANTTLSSLRVTLEKLKTIRSYNFSYYPADGFEIVRESIAYKPYSPYERKQIHEMLEQEMVLVKEKLVPYQKLDRKQADFDDPKIQARIIFEDHCNCIPIYRDRELIKKYTAGQRKLNQYVTSRRISLNELYDEWGVKTRRTALRDVGLYVLKMAQVLGMNLNPILDLEIDDYQKNHPLTNKPCLTYWKERSTGEKMIHLDLFQADLQWLSISQKQFVETVFNEVIKLTSESRKYAPDEISNRLFITYYKKCITITESTMSIFYSELVDKYHLEDDDGNPMVLTTTRFRPTLVSELVDAGVSIRKIQYLLGHASIYTTMSYLEKLDFDRVIKDKARKAIEEVYSKAVRTNKHNFHQKQQRRYNDNQIIMKTPLGGCKNIFDPPGFIKKSSFYVKGRPCSQYNKCLSCDNVMLTEKHLPELFAMQRDYLATLESSEVVNTPYHVVVLENLSLLDDILNPETSEFEEDTLILAKENSLFIETTILDSWGG